MKSRRRIRILAAAAVTITAAALLGPAAYQRWTDRGRQTLSEIVGLVIDAVERNDPGALRALCIAPDTITDNFFDRLKSVHKQWGYRAIFSANTPKPSTNKYTLGGHQFGYMHMEFVMSNGGWRFNRVWMCR